MKTTTEHSLLFDIFTNLGHLIWSKDITSGQISFLTNGFEKVYEVPMEELQANPHILVECIHPDDAPFIDLFSKVLLSSSFEQSEYRIITKKGHTKWLMERKQIVKNELGEIVRLDALILDISEQKEDELRLMESEATFKSLFYKHPNPMWVYDTESLYFLAVNDAAIKFYGYTHDEFFRMTVRQIRPKEDVEELLSAIRDNNFEQYSDKTWRHLKKDGSPIFVKLQSNPLNFRGQNARVALAIDITKEVEAEAKTEKIYTYLENFQEAVSKTSFLGLIDEKGNLSFVNEALLEKTRLDSSALMGKRWSVLFSNIHNNEDFTDSWNQIQKRKIWKAQRRFIQKNGMDFWVNCTIIPILDGQEATSQYLLIANDISNLKEAEKRNRDYTIKLHNILEGVTDALFVLDKNWLITNTNKEAEKLLEKQGDFLTGKNIWEILPAEEGFKFYQFFRKAKKKRITVQFEEFYPPKNQWFDISVYPSKDGLVVCFRDVSERKRKEEERKELLEHLVLQNRDLEEFTYITSHSLRAQVANISMLSAAVDQSGLTPLNQEIFDKLFQSSSNLNMVISDLNTILTIKNKNSMLLEEVQLSNVFVNAISKISAEYSPYKKFVTTDFKKLPVLKTIRPYLETVLYQIINNAFKFRALDKNPEIRIHSEIKDKKWSISIIDNGMGLDMEKNEKQILKLYKTFHPGISGKGLGLYLCKIMMDEIQGSLHVESNIGKGTTVTLIIPTLSN